MNKMKINLIKAGLGVVLVLGFTGCGNASREDVVSLKGEPVIMETEFMPETDVQNSDPAEEQIKLLMQNLSTEEFFSEAVAQLCHPEWTQSMLLEGTQLKRYIQESAYSSLYLQVENAQEGACTVLWYVEGEHVRVIICKDSMLQVMTSTLSDESYNGEFESWRLLADTGSVYRETGHFRDGSFAGALLVEAKTGNSRADLFSLWKGKEMLDLEPYGEMTDANGMQMLCQPEFPGVAAFSEEGSVIGYITAPKQQENPKEAPDEVKDTQNVTKQPPDFDETQQPQVSETPKPEVSVQPEESAQPEVSSKPEETPEPTMKPQETVTGQESEIEWQPDMM
jgi:hypothetical protein